jgi:hypothetical protein
LSQDENPRRSSHGVLRAAHTGQPGLIAGLTVIWPRYSYVRSIAWGEWGSSRPSRVNASRFSYERIALGYCVGVCGRAMRGRAVGGYSTQLYAEHHPQLRGLNPRPRCYFDDQCRRQRWRGASLCLRHGIGGFLTPNGVFSGANRVASNVDIDTYGGVHTFSGDLYQIPASSLKFYAAPEATSGGVLLSSSGVYNVGSYKKLDGGNPGMQPFGKAVVGAFGADPQAFSITPRGGTPIGMGGIFGQTLLPNTTNWVRAFRAVRSPTRRRLSGPFPSL